MNAATSKRLAVAALGILLWVGAAQAANYLEDFEIDGSQPFGTTDARNPSVVGWTAILDASFASSIGDGAVAHSNPGNLYGIANRNWPSTGPLSDFTSRYAWAENDQSNSYDTAAEGLANYADTLWHTSEPLTVNGYSAIDIQGTTFSFKFQGGGTNSDNNEKARVAIQLNNGAWYVSNTIANGQGTDTMLTYSLVVSLASTWDSLAVVPANAAGSKLNLTDDNVTLTAVDLASVVQVGFYTSSDSDQSPVGVDNFEMTNFVPEPATLAVLAGGAATGLLRRRRSA